MSGPITVVITANPVAALLAAAAIEAAAAVRAGYEQADALASAHAAQTSENRQRHSAAARLGHEALQDAMVQAEARFEELQELASDLGVAQNLQLFLEPLRAEKAAAQDLRAQQDYLVHLQTLLHKVETVLLAEAERRHEAPQQALGDITLPQQRQTLVQRLLARIAHVGEVPQHIAALAEELIALGAAEVSQRASLLATELRRAVQLHLEGAQKTQLQKATASIVEQTLKDLGYQVDGVGHTLFVEGGVAHFRKAGWGNYMVRMRVDAAAAAVNFNVIRAVQEGENERSVQDHLAEDRWCAEFPALLKALEARGVHLDVTRRLEAGELPVQLVRQDRLPSFAEEEQQATHSKPQTRTLR